MAKKRKEPSVWVIETNRPSVSLAWEPTWYHARRGEANDTMEAWRSDSSFSVTNTRYRVCEYRRLPTKREKGTR